MAKEKEEEKSKPESTPAAKPPSGGSSWFWLIFIAAAVVAAVFAYYGVATPIKEASEIRVLRPAYRTAAVEATKAYLEVAGDYLQQAKAQAQAANFGLVTEALTKALVYAQKAERTSRNTQVSASIQQAIANAAAFQLDPLKTSIDAALAGIPGQPAPVTPSPEAGAPPQAAPPAGEQATPVQPGAAPQPAPTAPAAPAPPSPSLQPAPAPTLPGAVAPTGPPPVAPGAAIPPAGPSSSRS